jgi:hypothetical protein
MSSAVNEISAIQFNPACILNGFNKPIIGFLFLMLTEYANDSYDNLNQMKLQDMAFPESKDFPDFFTGQVG